MKHSAPGDGRRWFGRQRTSSSAPEPPLVDVSERLSLIDRRRSVVGSSVDGAVEEPAAEHGTTLVMPWDEPAPERLTDTGTDAESDDLAVTSTDTAWRGTEAPAHDAVPSAADPSAPEVDTSEPTPGQALADLSAVDSEPWTPEPEAELDPEPEPHFVDHSEPWTPQPDAEVQPEAEPEPHLVDHTEPWTPEPEAELEPEAEPDRDPDLVVHHSEPWTPDPEAELEPELAAPPSAQAADVPWWAALRSDSQEDEHAVMAETGLPALEPDDVAEPEPAAEPEATDAESVTGTSDEREPAEAAATWEPLEPAEAPWWVATDAAIEESAASAPAEPSAPVDVRETASTTAAPWWAGLRLDEADAALESIPQVDLREQTIELSDEPVEVLARMARLRDAGLVTPVEFELERRRLTADDT